MKFCVAQDVPHEAKFCASHWREEDFHYLNRIMMAVAGADGINPIDVDAESWSGKYNTVHPYTEEEQKMVESANWLIEVFENKIKERIWEVWGEK